MELRQLRNFYVTANLLNMTKAANQLNVSQPALSISIQKLEDELGARLFNRDGHYISLTEAGRRILPLVSELFECEQGILDVCRGFSKEVSEMFIFADSSQPFIIDVASRFHHENPNNSFHFVNNDSFETRADIIITCSSEKPESIGGSCREIVLKENILVAVPRILRPVYESPITLDYILDNDLIGLGEKCSWGKVEREFLKRHGISLTHSITCDNSSVMGNLLMNGTGLAFVPEKTWLLQSNPAIHLIPFEIPGGVLHTRIYAPYKKNRNECIDSFFSFLLAELKKLDVTICTAT